MSCSFYHSNQRINDCRIHIDLKETVEFENSRLSRVRGTGREGEGRVERVWRNERVQRKEHPSLAHPTSPAITGELRCQFPGNPQKAGSGDP